MTDQNKILLAAIGAIGAALLAFSQQGEKQTTEPPTMTKDEAIRILISRAEAEKALWQNVVETDEAALPMLTKYWRSVGMLFGGSLGPQVPWSAAFIAYLTRAIPNALLASPLHWNYARHALGEEQPVRFRAVTTQQPVDVGDLVLTWRETPRSFADLANLTHALSHADLIVRTAPGLAVGIGGNKKNSVSSETYSLDSEGRLTHPRAVAILRLNAA